MAAVTIRIDDRISERLDRLAERLDRPRAEMAAQAIEDFVAAQEWQIKEIETGLAAADRGDFASDEKVAAVLARFAKHAGA